MKKSLVVLCTPSLGRTSVEWARALGFTFWPALTGKAIQTLRDRNGGEIAEARNALAAKALGLEQKADVEVKALAWLDDDVIPISPLWLQQLWATSQQHGREIVSGCYFKKKPVPEALLYAGPHQGARPFIPDGVFEVWGHGMGLCLVAADVYRKMAATLPSDKYGHPEWYKTPHGLSAAGNVLDSNEGTEDFYFLDHAARLGYKPVVDTSVHAFGFHVDDKGGELRGYPEPQFEQWRHLRPITWQTPDGVVAWGDET